MSQGKDILKQAHASFTDIKKIKRKVTGENVGDDKEKSKSMSSQSFICFQKTNPCLSDHTLDIPTKQVISSYKENLTLR